MKDITATSRANFAIALGPSTKGFIGHCDTYTQQLKDRAGCEKSEPLRNYLESLSERVQSLVSDLERVLGSSSR